MRRMVAGKIFLNENCSIVIRDSDMLGKFVITSISDEISLFEEQVGAEKLSKIASNFFHR